MARKVLLIGWDAADWKVIRPLMEAGRMPHLQRLMENGVSGSISTLHPALSPMLWTSIATGKRPFKHGIHGFTEPTADGRGVQPITNVSRKSKALWNILNQNGLRSLVMGWWPSHPAEPIDGVMVCDHFHRASGPLAEGWPLPAQSVHPEELREAIAGLRVHPDQLTAEMVEAFIPRAREIDQDSDQRLGLFLRTLAELMSVNSTALWLMEKQPWDFCAVYFDAIDHFCHGFMKFHPPRQRWIGEREFEIYQNVVSVAYQLHDEMLGGLLEKAGDETTVIVMSDHGFHPDHLRPASIPDVPSGPAVEHRDLGVLVMKGPEMKRGEVVYGASVLDIAPTVLALYELPMGEDIDGKVISQAFEKAPEIALIPSWEDVSFEKRRPKANCTRLMDASGMEQMIALGYIERPSEDCGIAVTKTIRELRYNLGEAYQDEARHAEAYEIFSELHAADRDEQRFAVRLFVSCQALGMYDEMRRIMEDMGGRRRSLFEEASGRIEAMMETGVERAYGGMSPGAAPEMLLSEEERSELARWRNLARYQPAVVDYLRAQVLVIEGRDDEAVAALERVGASMQRADLYLRVGRVGDAEQMYRDALENDPDDARAYLGLARVALRRRKFREATGWALEALRRNQQDPLAHFALGRALTGMREFEKAADAFRSAIAANPNFREAHVRLAALLEKHLGDAEGAREHRAVVRLMRGGAGMHVEVPPVEECLIVVTGLPRSGTSLMMQMLTAGGVSVVTDGLREADEDNPRGYLEFAPVKKLLEDAEWLRALMGKAIKIVLPLLGAVPEDLACRVVFVVRDLDEVLDSQQRMLGRGKSVREMTTGRRRRLKQEYTRALEAAQAMLAGRPATALLTIEYQNAIDAAEKLNEFLGGGLDVAKMAAVVDPQLHRNRLIR